MEKYFVIFQPSVSIVDRPPISYRIREYLMKFITECILEKKKIIVGGKWTVTLSLHFVGEGRMYKSRNIFLAKGLRTITTEGIKIYDIIIPLKLIQEAENPLLKTIELMYESVKIFLTTTYKKVSSEFMDELWKQIDLDYLLSLPYPAPLNEQKYIGDVVKPDGIVDGLQLNITASPRS